MDKTEERFLNKVKKVGQCWEWQAGRRFSGDYGEFYYKGKTLRAHRFAYGWYCGEIPPGKVVCHTCDNTLCVRPDHLFIGTQSDNIRDAYTKGRLVIPRTSTILPQTVKDIRHLAASGVSNHALARQFHIDRAHIRRIVNRTAHKEIP